MKIENKESQNTLNTIFEYVNKNSNQGVCGSISFFINAGEWVNDWTFKILYQDNFNIRTFHDGAKLLALPEHFWQEESYWMKWSIEELQKILIKVLECPIINIEISSSFEIWNRIFGCNICTEINEKKKAAKQQERLDYYNNYCESCGHPFEDED